MKHIIQPIINIKNSIVAWVPSQEEHLTMIGVYAIGGRVIDDTPRSYSRAESIAFDLSCQNSGSQGHYIPIYIA